MQRLRNVTGGMLALIAVGVLAVAVGVAWAVSSNGPYYAMPAWDQKLPASTRFVVLLDWGSEAVLDRDTGLVWEQAPATVDQIWANARGACLNSTKGGRRGWRLPSIAELASLVDPSVSPGSPTLPPGHPFTNVLSLGYWSATTSADDSSLAWIVVFQNGLATRSSKPGALLVWCVRGAMQESVY
jgi:hypothetical protein